MVRGRERELKCFWGGGERNCLGGGALFVTLGMWYENLLSVMGRKGVKKNKRKIYFVIFILEKNPRS